MAATLLPVDAGPDADAVRLDPHHLQRRIARAALVVMAGNVASRLLGLVREQTIAALFATTSVASVFVAASRVPTMVYDLLIGGAMTAALVPVFTQYAGRGRGAERGDEINANEGNEGAERSVGTEQETPAAAVRSLTSPGSLGEVAGATLSLAAAMLLPTIALLMLFARPLIGVLGVGFAPEVQEQGMLLVRSMLPAVILLGLASVLMAALYATDRYAAPSFAPALYNGAIVVCALALTPWLGIASLVAGVLAGAAAQLSLQLVAARGLRVRPSFRLGHPALRRIVGLYAPVALGLLISAGVVALDTRLASQTGDGSLAAMRYATTLVQLPLGLVASALSFSALPVLSRASRPAPVASAPASADDSYRFTLTLGLKLALLLITPATVALTVLRVPTVRLLFERGAFGTGDTDLTSLAVLFYAPQLPFVAIDQLMITAFYALRNTRTPMLLGLGGAVTYAAVALPLVGRWGMPALVLANTVQNSSHGILLFVLLWRWIGGLGGHGLGAATAKVAAAGGVMAGALFAAETVLPPGMGATPLGLLAYLVGAGAAGLAAYLVTLAVLRTTELATLWNTVARRHRH